MDGTISLTVTEYAAFAGVHRSTVRRWFEDGTRPINGGMWNASRGRRLRVDVPREVYEAWRATQEEHP